MITRLLRAPILKQKKSVLLLGPRQTGKSTLIRSLNPQLEINLAHEPTFLEFARNPHELDARLARDDFKTIFIDEVQRLPSLLNTIQSIVDQHNHIKFYLTGSSARKLKRGRANLLPGRLVSYQLGPLTSEELNGDFDLDQTLGEGLLPGVYTEAERSQRKKILSSYASTYLREEIQAEALTRNIEGFARFLSVAAARSGHILDLSKLASQAQVPRQSALRYFEILEDTLIVRRLESYSSNLFARNVRHPKFYFFDTGVLNGLLRNFQPSDDRKGILFEHFIAHELFHTSENHELELKISYYRTEGGTEVDFIVERDNQIFAIECKASLNIGANDLRHLTTLISMLEKKSPRKKISAFVMYLGKVEKVIDKIAILPWSKVLKEIRT